jgi:hypothetical protein
MEADIQIIAGDKDSLKTEQLKRLEGIVGEAQEEVGLSPEELLAISEAIEA